MQIFIDGRQQSDVQTEGRTVGELLEQFKEQVAGDDRMIVAIVCDGQTLALEQIGEALGKPADQYGAIDFQTAQPVELAKNSLVVSKELLAQIEGSVREIVVYLRQAEMQSAMEQMEPMFNKLNVAYKGLQGVLNLMKIDPESIELSSGNAEKFMTELVEKLREIKMSLENQDYVVLADLFEYELSPAIDKWQELIDSLQETLSSQ